MKRSVSLRTVGCRLNQADAARIAAQFMLSGYHLATRRSKADVYVINSCVVTATAQRKSIQYVSQARKQNPKATVVLAGCLAELKDDTLRSGCHADIFAGHEEKFRLPERLAGTDHLSPCAQQTLAPVFSTTRALLPIQSGCNSSCAYCIVPQVRGAQRSRPFDQVLTEACVLADSGHKELVLTGTNLGMYRHGTRTLGSLLRAIDRIPGIERIRLSSIEPGTCEDDVIDYMAGSSKACRYLHMPLQTGDDRLLSAMGRHYTVGQYRKLVERAVLSLCRFGLGSDVIVGLPGEDDLSFETTLAFLKELPFTNLHVFPYSRRTGTRADSMPNHVCAKTKRERAAKVSALAHEKACHFAEGLVGKRVTSLLESIDNNRIAHGWTSEYVAVCASGPDLRANQIVDFIPTHAVNGTLFFSAAPGKAVSPSDQ